MNIIERIKHKFGNHPVLRRKPKEPFAPLETREAERQRARIVRAQRHDEIRRKQQGG